MPVKRILIVVECFLSLVEANLPLRSDALALVHRLCLVVQARLELTQLALMRIKRLASKLSRQCDFTRKFNGTTWPKNRVTVCSVPVPVFDTVG